DCFCVQLVDMPNDLAHDDVVVGLVGGVGVGDHAVRVLTRDPHRERMTVTLPRAAAAGAPLTCSRHEAHPIRPQNRNIVVGGVSADQSSGCPFFDGGGAAPARSSHV